MPEKGFTVAKILAEGGLGLQNGFAEEGPQFCKGGSWAAKWFRRGSPFLQGSFFGWEIFVGH